MNGAEGKPTDAMVEQVQDGGIAEFKRLLRQYPSTSTTDRAAERLIDSLGAENAAVHQAYRELADNMGASITRLKTELNASVAENERLKQDHAINRDAIYRMNDLLTAAQEHERKMREDCAKVCDSEADKLGVEFNQVIAYLDPREERELLGQRQGLRRAAQLIRAASAIEDAGR